MNTTRQSDLFARYALALDEVPAYDAAEQLPQLSACIAEVLEHFPTANLSTCEKGEYYLQAANGFPLGNEKRAVETWFAAHADWTPCATLN